MGNPPGHWMQTMSQSPSSTPALACHPASLTPAERIQHRQHARDLLRERARSTEAVDEGYRLQFAPGDFADVVRFVELESRCCPFLSFRIYLAATEGALWLLMSGPPGARAVLETELELGPCDSCGCA